MGRKKKWTTETITQTIRKLHKRGESLCTRNMRKLGYSGMVTTTYRADLFGSWRKAIEAAGLDPNVVCRRVRKWTKERILERLRELHRKGVDLSHAAAKRDHQYLVVVGSRKDMFGSWQAAIEAAGLDYSKISRHRWWTKEKIVEEIKHLAAAGQPLSHDAAKRSNGALVSAASSPRYFGSWGAAVEAAGLNYDRVRKTNRWTKQRIIDNIQALNRQGERVNNANMRRLGYRGMMEAASRRGNFGSWAAAVEAAGLDYDEVRKT